MSIYLDSLNSEQRKAVLHTQGPVLILAGAGSGKTRVITNRVAYLIDEMGVAPWNILAITFTNKAAGEMKERVARIVGDGSDSVWVATFHSTCARILRRFADRLGYGNNFTIYDADDSKQLIRTTIKELGYKEEDYPLRDVMNRISRSKDNGYDAHDYAGSVGNDSFKRVIGQIYLRYDEALRKANAMDFDDLLLNTVKLFQKEPEILNDYRNRFRYIMVDEYQDTNDIQFELISLLAGGERNLCVVGDDDQSIYRFRGANIRNILEFELTYPDAYVVKLEQNYRSTGNILKAANCVIANNKGRKDKSLWTDEDEGELIRVKRNYDAPGEADFVVEDIVKKIRKSSSGLSDIAVLYRTNAQSRLFEEKLFREGIPYVLVGGVNFYARKEVKDLLAYLRTIDSGGDDQTTRRIINVPRRGIGTTTVERVQEYADSEGISFLRACGRAMEIISLSKAAASKCVEFADLINEFRAKEKKLTLPQLIEYIVTRTGFEEYMSTLDAKEDEADITRMDNVNELISKAADFEEKEDEPTLTAFLTDVALVSDLDQDMSGSRVTLMTLHSAKGLEFDHVYITGLEENTFPSWPAVQSEYSGSDEMEEERRLAYVGITRARKTLTLSWAASRMVRGEYKNLSKSRFIDEIPDDLTEQLADSERSLSRGYGAGRDYTGRKPQSSGTYGGTGSGYGIGSNRYGSESSGYGSGNSGYGSGNSRYDSGNTGYGYGDRKQQTGYDRSGHQDYSQGSFGSGGMSSGGGTYGSRPRAQGTKSKPRAVPKSKPFIAGAARQQSEVLGKAKTTTYGQVTRGMPSFPEPDYGVGDRVKHIKYGAGSVTDITKSEKDYKVTVEFDEVGQKIMYAAFAKLEKL